MKTIVFDFDGVINSYKSGWTGISSIPDQPVDGIKEAIAEIREAGYKVVVVSSRCALPEGATAIANYLRKYNIDVDDICREKPPAVVYVDDRAICFDGKSDRLLEQIKSFQPWNKKAKVEHVNHPAHYNAPGRKECIEEMVDEWGAEQTAIWCEMTAYKYEYRAGTKEGSSTEQDLAKRQWYLDKAKELRTTKHDNAAECVGNPAAMQMAMDINIAAPTANFAAPTAPTANPADLIKQALENDLYKGSGLTMRRRGI